MMYIELNSYRSKILVLAVVIRLLKTVIGNTFERLAVGKRILQRPVAARPVLVVCQSL